MQRVLDAMTGAPTLVRNGRLDVRAAPRHSSTDPSACARIAAAPPDPGRHEQRLDVLRSQLGQPARAEHILDSSQWRA
jgi:hypothetical protein